MENRLKALGMLLLNYAFLIIFGIVFCYFMEWLLEIPVITELVVGTMLIINTITAKHMRDYWKQLVLGRDNKGSIPKNKEPNDVFEDLKEKPTVEHGHLKENPLGD